MKFIHWGSPYTQYNRDVDTIIFFTTAPSVSQNILCNLFLLLNFFLYSALYRRSKYSASSPTKMCPCFKAPKIISTGTVSGHRSSRGPSFPLYHLHDYTKCGAYERPHISGKRSYPYVKKSFKNTARRIPIDPAILRSIWTSFHSKQK